MPTFRDREKLRYERQKTALFSAEACFPGTYKVPTSKGVTAPADELSDEYLAKYRHAFCLANDYAQENLYAGHREQAIAYFQQRAIPWHDGVRTGGTRNPSNHLCCSQSACVNALWPLTTAPNVLVAVFQPFLPQIAEALRFEADAPLPDGTSPFLAFEWIGTQNYLKEGSWGTRGANATSADFAFRYKRTDGKLGLVLGEWKYTEYYTQKLAPPELLNPTRWKIYQEHYTRWKADCPDLPAYESFFSDPFYQLMRLTLLARAMERNRAEGGPGEMGADHVTVVHVAPRANTNFANSLTSPSLKRYGSSVSAIWSALEPEHFVSIAAEDLLQSLSANAPAHLHGWGAYLHQRYGWETTNPSSAPA